MHKRYITENEVNIMSTPLPLETIKCLLSCEKQFQKHHLLFLVNKAKRIFTHEPNLLEISDPISLIGDIHGQYYDLLRILSLTGNLPNSKLLFLGDYVDRGDFSLETIMLILCLKVSYPKCVYLLRGNHESRSITNTYGFRNECMKKYDQDVYEAFVDLFDTLPLAAIIDNIMFAVHGGISDKINLISEINSFDRFGEPKKETAISDILWSDVNYDEDELKIMKNYERGSGILFTKALVLKFLKDNNLVSIIRAHEQCDNGFKVNYWQDSAFPSVLTIFSAPNYCDSYGNKGAIAVLNDSQLNIKQFRENEHPYVLKNHQNLFEWASPFIISKILGIFKVILQKNDDKFILDEYTLNRIEGIADLNGSSLHDLAEVLEESCSDSDSIVVPQDECILSIPSVSNCKPSLVLRKSYTIS